MAKFRMEIPKEIMQDFQKLQVNADEIFAEMTRAGAEVVEVNVRTNVPSSFHDSDIMNCLKITKTYKTPSDGGINTRVGFYGYFTNSKDRRVPAPLVANVVEYGSSRVKKKPFFRKSFKKSQIEKAMLDAQKKASGGLLK